MAAATSNDREVEEVFEEGEAPKQAQTIHRIRANSTIMQLSKILGESINYTHEVESCPATGATCPK